VTGQETGQATKGVIFLRVDRGGILRLRSEHVERLRLMD
jgi:hypothetical protein